jgi:hypothetical protein
VGLPLPRLLLSATSTVPSDRKFCTNAADRLRAGSTS